MPGPADIRTAEAYIRFCLAGAIAVARFDPGAIDRGDPVDLSETNRTLERLYERRAGLELQRLRRETEQLLESNWGTVVAIADVLLNEGYITASRLHGIMMAQAAGRWRSL